MEVPSLQIAKVVVNNNSIALDKTFDYGVPDGMNIDIGSRVLVPFGGGNRTISGVVTEISDKSKFGKLKNIKKSLDEQPMCTKELLNTALWMREKYVCTYNQAIKAVMPSGADVKAQVFVVLNDYDCDIKKIALKSKAKLEILIRLKEHGAMDLPSLCDISNYNNALRDLESKGIVSLTETVSEKIKSKTVRMAVISDLYDDLTEEIKNLHKKAPKQAKALEILRQTGELSVSDLALFSESSYNAINSLSKKGYIKFYNKEVPRNSYNISEYKKTEPKEPTNEQKNVLEFLTKHFDTNDKKPCLLHGVTGSGKTEVFLQIIAHVLNKGKTAIVLVPEISLTPQMVERFVGRFGNLVSVLHSSLSVGERFDEWKKIRKGEAKVVVGARSAIFAPTQNTGIIIIDEEHETTYKSENAPHYDAREIAVFRGKNEGATVLLGSATPSVISYYKAKQGDYHLLEMNNRFNLTKLPKVEVADMRKELEEGNKSVFSRKLLRAMEDNVKSGHQSILFLNRRGYNSSVVCRSCGEAVVCRNCNISMTYHKNLEHLKCHYCGYEVQVPRKCPSCGSGYIRFMGSGTEKIEEEIKKIFGEKSFIRMDADTTSGKNSHKAILDRFQNENIPFLLGTQMVTKGLDFKNVTLVGVLAADISLNIDDFRAAERTFCQLTQVCGRAGRGEFEGKAIIQTYQPENYSITYAKNHNYKGFYENEIKLREQLYNPPFCDIILIMSSGVNENNIARELEALGGMLRKRKLYVLGPVPAPYSKIKNKYRWRLIIKHKNAEELLPLLSAIMKKYEKSENNISIDINPNSMS